jgi:hypothetical protein
MRPARLGLSPNASAGITSETKLMHRICSGSSGSGRLTVASHADHPACVLVQGDELQLLLRADACEHRTVQQPAAFVVVELTEIADPGGVHGLAVQCPFAVAAKHPAESRFTTALRRVILRMPWASARVATTGKPSGTEAMASAMAVSSITANSLPASSSIISRPR